MLVGCIGGGITPPPATYTVSGRVTDASGQGIPGTSIMITGPTGSSIGTATTGTNGSWSATGLTGTVTFTPNKPGLVFDPESGTVSAAANNVDFEAIDLAMTYDVSGVVRDDKGSPLKNVTILFNRGFQSVTTGPDGRWQESGLHGTVIVTPMKPGWHFEPVAHEISAGSNSVDFTGEPAAGQLFVPQQYGTIQAAIAAAQDGYTITVSPGTYYECIDFMGKSITVQSEVPTDPEIVAATIIDGAFRGSVVKFTSGESDRAILQGFTIRNGSGTQLGGGTVGGGVYISGGSSPVLMHNVITQNQAAVGAGICIYETSTDAAGRSASPMSAQRAHSEIESIGIKLVARP